MQRDRQPRLIPVALATRALPLTVTLVQVLALALLGCEPPAAGEAAAQEGATGGEATERALIALQTDDVARAARQRVTIRVPVTGTFQPRRDATLAPAETGTVLRLGSEGPEAPDDPGQLEVGRYVQRGDALVTLENRLLRQNLVRMRGQLDTLRFRLFGNGSRTSPDPDAELAVARRTAQIEYERLRELAEQRAVPQAQLDAGTHAYAQARAAYEGAVKQLDAMEAEYALLAERVANLVVRAPFSGRVARVSVEVGEHVQPGGPVVSLIDDSQLDFVCGLPEAFAPHVRLGQTAVLPDVAEVGVDDLTVTEVGPQVDAANRTVALRARLSNPSRDPSQRANPAAERSIAAGRFANAVVVLDVLGVFVPATSVRMIDGRDRLFVVGADGVVEQRVVRRGVEGNGLVQVLTNLQAHEIVVARNVPGLATGARVDLPRETDEEDTPIRSSEQ